MQINDNDLASYDNPLHPRFVDDANGEKRARFERDMRWLHAEAIRRNAERLDDAEAWVLNWRSQPDDVEAAVMLAVCHLIDQTRDWRLRETRKAVQRKHERKMAFLSQQLESAA